MKIITIDKNNIDSEHICCAIGNDKKNKARAHSKKEWMKERFEEGLKFQRLDDRGKIFIEYMPIEKVWKPIRGKNFMVINCLWVSGKFKGKGISTQLLNGCIKSSKAQKMDGVAVITSNKVKAFLTDKKFYLKHGFEIVDTAPPYFELLVLKFNSKVATPLFTDIVKKGSCFNEKGLTFIYSNQCPFMEEYIEMLSKISIDMKIPVKVKRLENYTEAQGIGSPFGTLGIYYNGLFKTHELLSEKKFKKFIEEIT